MTGAPLPRPGVRDHARLLRRIFHEPTPVLDELRDRFGPVCQLGGGPVRITVIGDPTALREMFALPAEQFRWGHKFNVLGFIVGNGSMIVSDGDDHRRRRGAVQPAFGRRRLNGWIPMIVERTDAAINAIDTTTGEPLDLYEIGRALVFDIAVRAFFGAGLADRIPELERRFDTAQAYLESPAVRQLPHPFPFTARARVRADRRAIDSMIDEETVRLRSEPGPGQGGDVLETLVGEGDLSDAEIRDQVVSLIGAGFHTTAASLAWTLWRVVLAPGIWSSLRAEADAVLGSVDSPAATPDAGTLARLELADRVVRETLRLHPAGVISPRETTVDMTLGGYRIPKRTLILWSAHLAGRNRESWDDPLRCDPDRWLDPDEVQRVMAEAAWVPFGRPARNCIGFAMAQMELVLIVARLAQRLDLRPMTDAVPDPFGMVVNRPSNGVSMRVDRRG